MYQIPPMPVSAITSTICICAAFGANVVAIKVCLSGMGPYTTAALRFIRVSLAIYAWARLTGQPYAIDRRQVYQLLVLTVIFTVQLSLLYLICRFLAFFCRPSFWMNRFHLLLLDPWC